MKNLILLSMIAFLFILAIPVYAQNQTEGSYLYNHNIKYDGSFEANRVYLYNEADGIWQTFKSMNQFRCYEARTSLVSKGTWIGNISDEGQCLGSAEAPEWTSGNYLNFKHEKNK